MSAPPLISEFRESMSVFALLFPNAAAASAVSIAVVVIIGDATAPQIMLLSQETAGGGVHIVVGYLMPPCSAVATVAIAGSLVIAVVSRPQSSPPPSVFILRSSLLCDWMRSHSPHRPGSCGLQVPRPKLAGRGGARCRGATPGFPIPHRHAFDCSPHAGLLAAPSRV